MPTAEIFPHDFSFLDKIPERDLEDLVVSLNDGVATPGEALGFSEEALNTVEQVAIAHYHAQKLGAAATLFGFMLQMNPRRASAWRGLGACAQTLKKYGVACHCYDRALHGDASDIVSHVYLGESLCLLGKREEGVQVLMGALTKGAGKPEAKPYLLRARAIVVSDGMIPNRIFMSPKAHEIHQRSLSAIKATSEVAYDPDKPLHVDDIKRNPALASSLKDLETFVKQGRLSFGDIGGFTDKEINGTYAVAANLVANNQDVVGLQLAGFLLMLDPYKPRYYQLAGIAFQHLKQYPLADFCYDYALVLEQPKDARTLAYKGESRIMMGDIDTGVKLVREGVAAAANKREYEDVLKRGEALLKQFAK